MTGLITSIGKPMYIHTLYTRFREMFVDIELYKHDMWLRALFKQMKLKRYTYNWRHKMVVSRWYRLKCGL